MASKEGGTIQGFDHHDRGDAIPVGEPLAAAAPAMLLPCGVFDRDQLRQVPEAVAFVRHVVEAGKPVGATGHGPWTLIEAEAVCRRRMPGWPSSRTDLRNAGAARGDEEVVTGNGLVTSRKPDDFPPFSRDVIEEFREGQDRAR